MALSTASPAPEHSRGAAPERKASATTRAAPASPEPLGLQPVSGLLVGRADDPADADRMADRAMLALRRSLPSGVTADGAPAPVLGASGGPVPHHTGSLLRSARAGGLPIPDPLRRSTADAGHAAVTVQGGGTWIRRTLDVGEVLDAVEKGDYLKQKLASGTDAQTRKSGSAETMRARVEKILAEHQSMFAADDAMSIAIAIDGVAKVVASELYDNSLKPVIAQHLMKKFRSKLQKALPQHQGKQIMKKARALVSTDALALYMHHERQITDAAWDIKDAADRAGVAPDVMFDLLSQKFQAEMASYSFTDVANQQDTSGTFNRSEATGELSTNYLKELFGGAIETSPGDAMPKKDDGKGAKFDPAAAKRLSDLKAEVDATTVDGAVDPRATTPAQRRQRFLDQVKSDDDAVSKDRTKQVVTELQTWGITKAQAKEVVTQLRAGLPNMPLTITHWSQPRTAKGKNFDTKDVSRSGQKNKVTVQGEKFATLGKYVPAPGGADRGEHYMQFRGWKDRMMTGNQGMEGSEMPVFGALNPLFTNYKGTDATPVPTRSDEHRALSAKKNKSKDEQEKLKVLDKVYAPVKAEVDRREGLAEDQKVGMNYYGDMHLVLRRDRVKDRLIYTAGDHGRPHRDPFLVFADFLLGSTGTYRADLTRLKGSGGGQPDGMKNTGYAKALVAIVLGTDKVVKTSLPFEIQIHGGVDWEQDVEEIWISPGAPQQARDRMQAWSTAKPGRPAVRVVTPPPTGTVLARNLAEFADEGPAEAKKL